MNTLKGLFTSVGTNMFLQISLGCRTKRTVSTVKRSFASVGPNVIFHAGSNIGGVSTVGTLIHLVVGAGQHS